MDAMDAMDAMGTIYYYYYYNSRHVRLPAAVATAIDRSLNPHRRGVHR